MRSIIIFMGGPGSGKGVFAKRLLQNHKFNYIETGAIFRALPADSEIAQIIANGEMVPDEKVLELIKSKIDESFDNLFDGFPRTTVQAKWLVNSFADKFLLKIFYLNVPEKLMLQRIIKRAKESKDKRPDDININIIMRRLDSFRRTTMPAIDWLRANPSVQFFEIDGASEKTDNIFENIKMEIFN